MRALLLAFPLAFATFSLTGCASKDPTPHTYQIGESVPLGHLVYTVFERQWLPQAGAGFTAQMPQYRLYAIRIAAANNGSAVVILPSAFLVDDQGVAIPEIEHGDGIADFLGSQRALVPAETIRGNLVFDVPPKHYKLRLSDEDGKKIALVDIPLSFETDTQSK